VRRLTLIPHSFLTRHCFSCSIGGRASQLNVPPQATEAIQLMYSGNSDQAIVLARNLEAAGRSIRWAI